MECFIFFCREAGEGSKKHSWVILKIKGLKGFYQNCTNFGKFTQHAVFNCFYYVSQAGKVNGEFQQHVYKCERGASEKSAVVSVLQGGEVSLLISCILWKGASLGKGNLLQSKGILRAAQVRHHERGRMNSACYTFQCQNRSIALQILAEVTL